MKRSEMVKMMMTYTTFCLVSTTFGQSEKCITNSEKINGTCEEIKDCFPTLQAFTFGQIGDTLEKHGNCEASREGNLRICCPIYPDECTAPSVKTGTCQLIENCSELPNLSTKLSLSVIQHSYVGDCTSERDGKLKICCPVSPEKCTASKVPNGTCQVVPGACPELNEKYNDLPYAQFRESYYGGCKILRNGTSRYCCPDSTMTDDYKVVCYFTNWSWHRKGEGKYRPSDIDPSLCTHIIYAFAILDKEQLTIKSQNEVADYRNMLYEKVAAHKSKGLKVLVSIGGWNDSKDNKYSLLVATPDSRSKFIDHVIKFIKDNNFDGLDLDWEHPVCWQLNCRSGPVSDKNNFAAFVKELKQAFKPHGLLLSSTAPYRTEVLDKGYDVPTLFEHLDWISVTTYNYYSSWGTETGHVAPLYANFQDHDITLNINYTINYFLNKGANPKKIVMGMPMFGNSFTLADANANTLYQNAIAPGEPGPYIRQIGSMAYYEICYYIQKGGWTVVKDPEGSMGPYAYKGNQWVSFDDTKSISYKTDYIKKMRLGGAMVWSLDQDDFNNQCGCENYPLLKTINRGLDNYAEPDPGCSSFEDKCTALRVKTGTCQLIDNCAELPNISTKLSLAVIRHSYVGDCTSERNGELKICCPVPPEKCTALKVPNGTCQVVPGACPELNEAYNELPAAQFHQSYNGGCKTLRNGTSQYCCPVSAPTAPECLPPATDIPNLGCIKFETKWMTWDDAQAACERSNGRLLENINKEHIDQLAQYAPDYVSQFYDFWIGVQSRRWSKTGGQVPQEFTFQEKAHSGNVKCGLISLDEPPSPYIWDETCSMSLYSLCHILNH